MRVAGWMDYRKIHSSCADKGEGRTVTCFGDKGEESHSHMLLIVIEFDVDILWLLIMSHSHSHAPGDPSHSHGPQQPQQPQQAVMPSPDPALLALIDQDFHPVPLALGSDGVSAVCEPHKLEKCDNCNLDFDITNRLTRLLAINPNLACPPPSNVVSQKLTQLVTTAKDEGNVSLISCSHLFMY